MACEVCEHCHDPVFQDEAYAVREGYSYHEKCHKCYVCSETDLQNAEVFKGVIFCSSCSQRIFQGCFTARKTKNSGRRNSKSHKRRVPRAPRRQTHDGILELTTLAVSGSSNSSPRATSQTLNTPSKEHTVKAQTKSDDNNHKISSMKKSSVEMGMTTEVTQELLKQMNCPVAECRKQDVTYKPRKKKRADCSDLRIAELGASTEIANMALRNKSELPVIIKSESRIRKLQSLSVSQSTRRSDDSGVIDDGMDSAYSSLRDSIRTPWMERRFGSILKLPYKAFKKNILARSSLISVLIRSENDVNLMKQIKLLFSQDITDHQKRGLQRLYSTINRKQVCNKLGWLQRSTYLCSECKTKKRSDRCLQKRCKHFRTSHSYRCMRAHVMRLAGPTASQLAGFRNNVKNIVSPGYFLNISSYNKKYAAIISQACGNSKPGSTKL